MGFRIRKKGKGNQKAKKGNTAGSRNDKEKRQELAEWDAIAESSRKPGRDESNHDTVEEEP